MNGPQHICVFVALASLCPALASFGDAREAVLAELAERRMFPGVDAASGDIVEIGSERFSVDGDGNAVDMMSGEAARTHAFERALAAIVGTAKSELAASNLFARVAGSGKRTEATVSASSDFVPCACEVVAVAEAVESGGAEVAMALVWSERREKLLDESRQGVVMPASDWQKQLAARLRKLGLGRLPPYGCFVDDCGAAHLYAVAEADVYAAPEELRENELKVASLTAQRRLAAVTRGAAATRQEARAELISGRKPASARSRALAVVRETDGTPVPYETVIDEKWISGNGRPIRVLVVAECVSPRRAVGVAADADSSDLKLFNPATGKFEKGSGR